LPRTGKLSPLEWSKKLLFKEAFNKYYMQQFQMFMYRVAQFPEELVTYGGNGQVLSNWGQFRIVLHYLATMTGRVSLPGHHDR
jgi:urocanate hydratase